jgi:uncharacterized cofD-like protein
MNITIFSGGSGSEQLQEGLWSLFGEHVHISIIVNGYDDGKSTGIVRKVCNQMILGPSDLRKNQLIRHRLRHGKTSLYNFLQERVTSLDPKPYIINQISVYANSWKPSTIDILLAMVEYWFSLGYAGLYEDFNIGNIIYASLFINQGIKKSIQTLNDMLDIPDEVLFHSNEALQLHAYTESGILLDTEESIVNHCSTDRIKEVFLTCQNKRCIPELESYVVERILNSDIILFSCGTQWSSLIPTYLAKDFYSIIQHTTCPKYLVLNLKNDKDMIGYDYNDYISLLESYLPLSNITLLFSDKGMMIPSFKYEYCVFTDCVKENVHDGVPFMVQLFMHYFRDKTKTTSYIFDYDYTLYDCSQSELSKRIRSELETFPYSMYILSANHYKNIPSLHIPIISNNGCIDYSTRLPLHSEFALSENDKQEILKLLSCYKNVTIEDRIVSISIKPFQNQTLTIPEHLRETFYKKYKVVNRGKTTVEIMYHNVSKKIGYDYIRTCYKEQSFLYISDEDDVEEIAPSEKWITKMSHVLIFLTIMNRRKSYLPNLLVISGGVNVRMNQTKPKVLMTFQDKSNLQHIYEKTIGFIKDIFVLTNDKHTPFFTDSFYHLINCGMPRGSLETIRNSNHGFHRFIVIWGDCFLPDSRLISELSSQYHRFIIPCNYEPDPYAYVITKDNYSVESFGFRRTSPIEYGLHDLSIFYVEGIQYEMERIMDKEREEYHLFDIFPGLFPKAIFYKSKYTTYSYNTQDEYKAITLKIENKLT